MVSNNSCPSILFSPTAPVDPVGFGKGSIEEYISARLAGKIKETGNIFVAQKVGYMINSYANNNGANAEERAMNREVGLRLAKQFAKAFIENPVESQAFIEVIKYFAIRDNMMEKGYYYWGGQIYGLYRPIPNSIIYKRCNTHWSQKAAEAYKTYEQEITRAINEALTSQPSNAVANRMNRILAEYSSVMSLVNEGYIPGHCPCGS